AAVEDRLAGGRVDGDAAHQRAADAALELRGDVPAGRGLERLVARVVRQLRGDAGEVALGDDGLGPPLAAVVEQGPRLTRGHRGVRLVAQLEHRAERLAPRRDAQVRRAAG